MIWTHPTTSRSSMAAVVAVTYCNPLHFASEDWLWLCLVPILCLQAPRLGIMSILYARIVILSDSREQFRLCQYGYDLFLHTTVVIKTYMLYQKSLYHCLVEFSWQVWLSWRINTLYFQKYFCCCWWISQYSHLGSVPFFSLKYICTFWEVWCHNPICNPKNEAVLFTSIICFFSCPYEVTLALPVTFSYWRYSGMGWVAQIV